MMIKISKIGDLLDFFEKLYKDRKYPNVNDAGYYQFANSVHCHSQCGGELVFFENESGRAILTYMSRRHMSHPIVFYVHLAPDIARMVFLRNESEKVPKEVREVLEGCFSFVDP